MPRTLQKKNNFNHGMVQADLAERVDLDLLNKSAALLENMTPIIFGGVRSRRGTQRIAKLQFQSSSLVAGTSRSELGDASGIQSAGCNFVSNAVGTTKELFAIDYPSVITGGKFNIFGLKFLYRAPSATLRWYVSGQNAVSLSEFQITDGGIGFEGECYIPAKGRSSSKAAVSLSYNEAGTLVSATITNQGSYQSTNTSNSYATFTRGDGRWICSANIMISTDNQEWTKYSDIQITENSQDFTVDIKSPFKYIKVVLDDSIDNIKTKFSLGYVQMQSAEEVIRIGRTRMIGFVDSNMNKYLVVIGMKNIVIFKDGVVDQLIIAPAFTENVFDEIKWAQKDDTIIFTQKDMPPQRLLKTDTGWNFGEYPLKNIPMYDFGGLSTAHKSDIFTPSATDGTVVLTAKDNASIFTSDMVGQYIDNAGGAYCKIVEFISASKIRVRTIVPFYSTDSVNSWDYIHGYEQVWSYKHGWPRACAFVQQRLVFGGSRDIPSTIWLSRLGDYNNFQNIGNYDNDAIEWPLLSNSSIVNIVVQRNMHVFTSHEEWTVPENSFTPGKFSISKINENGCWKQIAPVVYENAVLSVEKNGKSLYFYGYDESSGGFASKNISLFLKYDGLPIDMAVERNSVKDKGDFLYLLMDAGYMYIHALGLSENINAPSIFKTTGEILSVAVVQEDVYLAVRRQADVFIEKIAEEVLDFVSDVQVVDGQIQNLTDYIGMNVVVEQDGRIIKRTVDSTGKIKVESLENKEAKVGIPFKYTLKSNPIAINGQTTAIRKRINHATIETIDTPLIQLNGQIDKNKKTYDFWAVSEFERDSRYIISGEYSPCRILSVQLDISYEG